MVLQNTWRATNMSIPDGPTVALSFSPSTSAALAAQHSTPRSQQAQSTVGRPTPTRFPISNGLYVSLRRRIPPCPCSSWAIQWCACAQHISFHILFWSGFVLKFTGGSVYRAVHWYSHSRRVPIRGTAFRSCRELLRQV